MALFRIRKPNLKALTRRGDVDGLVAAAGFQDLIPAPGGGMVDRGARVRQGAILAIGELGPELGTDAVKAALSDPSDGVRIAAIRVLFARRDAVPLATALEWLPVDQGHSRSLAMRALLELRLPDCAAALAAALVRAPGDAPAGDDETALLKVLLDGEDGSEAASEVVEELLIALADELDPVADRAEELLAEIAPISVEGVIAELQAGPAPQRAAAVLAEIKDTRALEPLMEGLLRPDPSVRAECARALGELRDPAAVEVLIHASRDPEHRVRAQAGWALDRIGMVALMVGVSTMIRPMLLEAAAGSKERPALTQPENGSTADGDVDVDVGAPEPASDPISPEALERLLAGMDEIGDAGEFR